MIESVRTYFNKIYVRARRWGESLHLDNTTKLVIQPSSYSRSFVRFACSEAYYHKWFPVEVDLSDIYMHFEGLLHDDQ